MIKKETIDFIKAFRKYLDTLSERDLERFANIIAIRLAAQEDYPHDKRCEGSMCYCANRAKKENPEKWLKYNDEAAKGGEVISHPQEKDISKSPRKSLRCRRCKAEIEWNKVHICEDKVEPQAQHTSPISGRGDAR